MIRHGDCLEILKEFPDNFFDSLVTDPPAGISFMGKEWDKSDGFIPSMTEAFKECLRVMKPGAHGFVWAIPRTSHWTATALEDAGFEIRDVVTHIFGSGFPKSMNISIAIDKQSGAMKARGRALVSAGKGDRKDIQENKGNCSPNEHEPITPAAAAWQGWGTALKPASEHWILVRKPISEKTVASNVLKHGTGGINIDASRICGEPWKSHDATGVKFFSDGETPIIHKEPHSQGRFPANLVLSHNEDCVDECTPGCAVAELDRQSGVLKSGGSDKSSYKLGFHGGAKGCAPKICEPSSGGASRFFYCAKASKRERNEGCEGLPVKTYKTGCGGDMPIDDNGKDRDRFQAQAQNHHPTVKPIKLMQYLITMITPTGGTVLDPFMGSGSTGVAAVKAGFKFIGIEREKDYVEIAEKRIAHYSSVT